VGGNFNAFNPPVGFALNYIAKYTQSTDSWASLESGVDGPVKALLFYGGRLFVGGNFSHAGGISANNIAMWDGAWHTVGSGPMAR